MTYPQDFQRDQLFRACMTGDSVRKATKIFPACRSTNLNVTASFKKETKLLMEKYPEEKAFIEGASCSYVN